MEITNYAAGPRGVNTKAGTVWIEPGASHTFKKDDVVGSLPDLGKKPAAGDDVDEGGALTAAEKRADDAEAALKKAQSEIKDLTKQVEELTKPK